MLRRVRSIDIHGPHSNETEDVVVDVVLVRNRVGVTVPKISTASLYTLSFLVAKNHLYNVLVTVSPHLLQLVFYAISDLLAQGIQIGWWLLFRGQFVLQNGLNDFPRFGRLEFLAVFRPDLVFVDIGGSPFLRHFNSVVL